MNATAAHPKTIEIVVVHGTNKDLEVKSTDSIDAVKVAAMGLYGIPDAEKGSYVLRAKVRGDEDEQLDEAKTVEDYHLHNRQKVVLASGSPFGS
jgi:hypothetical protein